MAYTTHGNHVPGTDWDNPPIEESLGSLLCDGLPGCAECKAEVDAFVGTSDDYPAMAKAAVKEYVMKAPRLNQDNASFETYVVMFGYILGGWKALVSTTIADSMYYEVTFDKVKRRIYLDAYQKYDNVTIPV